MRILVLCKRQYTGKDLLDDRYGRLHELPAALAERGHAVSVLASSYRHRGALQREERGVHWRSFDSWPWLPKLMMTQEIVAKQWRPDVIWVSSDAPHLVAGTKTARRLGIPVVLDLYDDYEAFGLTRLLGLRRKLRWACSEANALTVVSGTLSTQLAERGKIPTIVKVVGNGVPDGFGSDLTKEEARKELGLPVGRRLIGTAGTLDSSRGIKDLFRAARHLQTKDPALCLVVAGRRGKEIYRDLPPGTIDLGELPHHRIALLFRALDVGVICNVNSDFGHACHPQKLVEMAACGLPLVAAEVGETARLLAGQLHSLYPPADPCVLAERIVDQLAAPRIPDLALGARWAALAMRTEAVFEAVIGAAR